MTAPARGEIEPKAFDEASEDVLRAVRASLTDALAAVGLAGVRPMALAERLAIDKSLASRLARFIRDPDPLAGFRHLPGAGGMEILLRAVAEAGADDARLDEVRRALDRLDRLIDDHGGDRATFQVLAEHHAGAARGHIGEGLRKQLFRAAAGVWGVQARAKLLLAILAPNADDPSMLDVAHVSGFIDLQRLRPDLPWVVRRSRYQRDDEPLRPASEPLEPGVEGTPLLRRFCSEDLPPIRSFPAPDGFVYDELSPGRVGKVGAVTCLMGEIGRAVARHAPGPDNRAGTYTLTVRTPIEQILFDVLVHRDVHHARPPSLTVHSLYEGRPPQRFDEPGVGVLPIAGRVEPLGSPPVLQTPALGAYPEIAAFAFDRAGWRPREFTGWRVSMAFPPAPCNVALRFELAGA